MDIKYLSSTDLKILLLLVKGRRSISELSDLIGLSLPTISGSVKNLDEMGLISRSNEGRTRYIFLNENEVGNNFRIFVEQNPNLDPNTLLRGNGLRILSLIGSGSTLKEIVKRTGVSRSTISRYISKWKGIGILWKEGHGGKIRINDKYPDLKKFLRSYLKYRLETKVNNEIGNPLILFNDGETLIFTCDDFIDNPEYLPAGYTYLAMKGFDVVTAREYYRLSLREGEIDILEALVQAIRSDMLNPRPRKILREQIENSCIDIDILMEYAKKYGIDGIIEKEVK